LTKATQTIKTSSEADSNIIINVADCGVWDDGDSLQIDVAYLVNSATEVAVINQTTHPAGIEFGTIELNEVSEASCLLALTNQVMHTAQANAGGALTLMQVNSVAEGGNITKEVAMSLAGFLVGTAQSVQVEVEASVVLNQNFALALLMQAVAEAGLSLDAIQSITISSTAIVLVTPDERRLVIAFEDRTMKIAP